MWFKRNVRWTSTHLFLLFLLAVPSTVQGKTDTWSQVLHRGIIYRDAGNCDAQWRLMWDYKEKVDSYSYLALAAMAIFGVHPELSKEHMNNKSLAFQFAVISGLKGQILNLEELEKVISGDNEDVGMAFAMGLAREILLQASMEEKGRYYSPMFQSCLKQSDVKYCVEEYVSETKIDTITFIQQLDEKLTHPDTRIECTKIDFH